MDCDPLAGVAVFVAAERLGLTKSAVGKTVARLEERLGFKLFHRTTRLTRLTADGEAYLVADTSRPSRKLLWPRQRHLSPRVRHMIDQLVANAAKGRLD